MRRLLLDATVLEDSEATTPPPAAPVTRTVQWAYAQLTQPATQMPNLGTPGIGYKDQNAGGHKNALISEAFPYTVPAGYQLGIVAAQFSSKVSEPSSYMVVQNAFSVPSHGPLVVFPQPFLLPAGQVLNVCFINNSTWDQWMSMVLQGVLIPVSD